jgi:photosystem II stability/assembly factor-like uncharacterized protein
MKKTLLSLMVILALSITTFAQTWTAVNSNLGSGVGVGQISVGMNNPDALWAYGVDNTGLILDTYTKSTDGGLTWTKGTFNAGSGLSQLFAIDENTCWAVFNTGATQGLYKTTDGGTTWAKQGTAFGSSSFADAMHFFNATDGFAIGDPVGGYFEIYTTTDGGSTWTRVVTGSIPAPLSGEYGITGDYCAYGNNVWFGTNKGRIFRSTDKGLTWTAVLTPFGTSQVIAPEFTDALHGIAYRSYLNVGIGDSLNVTADGGVTWQGLEVIGSMYGRYIIHIPGTATYVGSTGVAGTDQGVSYSTDGGAHWTVLTVGGDYEATAWLNPGTGWAGSTAASKKSTGGMFIYSGDSLVQMTANFTADVTGISLGQSVTYTNLSAGFPNFSNWYFEGGSPATYSGVTPPPITYNAPGSYDVKLIVTNDWTTDTLTKTDYIYVGGVGINELREGQVSCYPNPTKDIVNVTASQVIQDIRVVNMVGQLVLEQNVNSKSIILNLSDLKSGVFTLKSRINNNTTITKIVVE